MDLPYNVRNALQCSKDKDALWGSVDGITSETTHDLCEDLQNDNEGSKPPELPRLPTRHAIPTSKKRDREEYLASSSDPPLFSSDDLPSSSADNYLEQRHKRQYQRSWFEPEDLSNLSTGSKSSPVTVEERSSRAKIRSLRGPFTRAFDSGVWMGSDETEENDVDLHEDIGKNTQAVPDFEAFGDEDIDLAEEACALSQTPEEDRYGALVHKAMQTIEDPNDFDGPVFPYWQKQPNCLQAFHYRQELAQKRVSECIDKGAEDLDLSGLDLQQIRTPTLRPLRYHTKRLSILEKGSRYQPLIPSLRLYLSNNLLDDVPGEVYHLKNLEVLSLRSNNLTEILPSISALEDLHEVNFGSNQLKWLPWEFLHILQFQNWTKRTLHPNPFIRPIPSIWGMKIHRNRGRHSRGHIVSTHIAFLDISGASQRDYPPAPTSVAEHWAEPVDNEEVLRPPREERIRTPSLMELAIRACYKAPQLSQLPFLLPSNCPTHLRQLLESTWKLKEAGGRKCSVCSREYIIPRTEWIEWWYCIAEDEVPDNSKSEVWHQGLTPLPFLRRGCSWQCFIEKPPDAPIRGWTSAAGPGGHPEELDLVKHS